MKSTIKKKTPDPKVLREQDLEAGKIYNYCTSTSATGVVLCVKALTGGGGRGRYLVELNGNDIGKIWSMTPLPEDMDYGLTSFTLFADTLSLSN